VRARSILSFSYFYGLLWLRRNPLAMAWVLSMPFTILFLVYMIAGEAALPYALVGSYVMISAGAGVWVLGDAAWLRLEIKLQDVLIASPVSATDYILGLTLANLLWYSPAIAIVVPLLIALGAGAHGLLALTLAPLLACLPLSALSFHISAYIPNVRNGWQIATALNLIYLILPPVFYPVEVVPELLRPVAYALPTVHVAILLRDAVGVPSTFPSIASWAFLIAAFLASLMFTAKGVRWRES